MIGKVGNEKAFEASCVRHSGGAGQLKEYEILAEKIS